MRIKISSAARKAAALRTRGGMPLVFGREARTRVLVALAVNGPMHVRDLARTIGSDSHKTYDMVEHFISTGILVKRNRVGGRKYVALDRSFALYDDLMRLLLRVAQLHGIRAKDQPRYRWGLPKPFHGPRRGVLDDVLGSRIKTAALLGIVAAGEIDQRSLSRLARIKYHSLWACLPSWETQGIVRSRYVGRYRLLSLNPDYYVVEELRGFLEGLLTLIPRFHRMRQTWLREQAAAKALAERRAQQMRARNAARALAAYQAKRAK